MTKTRDDFIDSQTTHILVTTRDNATGEIREQLFDTDFATVKDAFKPGSLALNGRELIGIVPQG
tara:strand:+ start:954 stop:1145 length:192 start_codon:yes stop_codon:yes gene_type:complete